MSGCRLCGLWQPSCPSIPIPFSALYSIPGKGSFAAANAGADENRKRELLNKVREILAELRYLGVSRQELLDLIEEEALRPPAGGAVSAAAETAIGSCGTTRQEERI